VFSPAYLLGELGRGYLLLVEQHLPGMAGHLENKSVSLVEEGFPLKDVYNRLLLGSMPPGFSGGDRTGDTSLKVNEKPLPIPEHLIVANSGMGEIQSATAADTPLSLLVNPGTLSPETYPLPLEGAPRVLIYHTHTTESFLPVSGKPFTSELEQSVVFLGEALTQILEKEYGIPVLHHREIFDMPRRDEAYTKARPAIAAILEENPQIEIVVDLHRDGISREISTFSFEGEDTARILFVVDTRHADWNSNLRFALFLQNTLDEIYPGLCRGTRRQAGTYNQHVHPRSVLVEIGGHHNNREEVLRAVPYLAAALAEAFH
jgi:stage II sporulation protein P